MLEIEATDLDLALNAVINFRDVFESDITIYHKSDLRDMSIEDFGECLNKLFDDGFIDLTDTKDCRIVKVQNEAILFFNQGGYTSYANRSQEVEDRDNEIKDLTLQDLRQKVENFEESLQKQKNFHTQSSKTAHQQRAINIILILFMIVNLIISIRGCL